MAKKIKKGKLPTDIEMDKQILKIMDKNLVAGTTADNTEGIICNRFATSMKIVKYIKKLHGIHSIKK